VTATAATTPAARWGSPTEIIPRWPGFIHGQAPALQRLPVEARDGPFYVFAIRQFDKSEAPRLAGHLIANDDGRSGLKSSTANELVELGIRHFVWKITHEQPFWHESLQVARRALLTTFAIEN
jgi:hypothetical protein